MTKNTRKLFFVLRLSFGWFFLYAGVSKIMNTGWSAYDYLQPAKTFVSFYQWLASPVIIDIVNFINVWALTLLGISLILGLFLRVSTIAGILLMILYYFPVLDFPKAGQHSFLIDEHIIYALLLLVIHRAHAARFLSIDSILIKKFKR